MDNTTQLNYVLEVYFDNDHPSIEEGYDELREELEQWTANYHDKDAGHIIYSEESSHEEEDHPYVTMRCISPLRAACNSLKDLLKILQEQPLNGFKLFYIGLDVTGIEIPNKYKPQIQTIGNKQVIKYEVDNDLAVWITRAALVDIADSILEQ